MRHPDEHIRKVQISCFLYVQKVLIKFMLHTAVEGFKTIVSV